MKLSRITTIASLFLTAILSAPAFASPDANYALPGTLNYVEGQANIGGDSLGASSIGQTTLRPGETLETGNGKAEILLTPGVFLRIDNNSTVEMISPSLTNTEVKLDQGRAMVEVTEIHDQNNLRVTEDGVTTQMVQKGLYAFDADGQQILVFDGKAHVFDGDRVIGVGSGHAVDLRTNGPLQAYSFDKDDYTHSDLYQWSSLRSSYLADANVETAQVYVNDGYYASGWYGPGWYWSPVLSCYTFIPGDGILYSPFGWGYYSPLVVYRAPIQHWDWRGHVPFNDGDRDDRGWVGNDRGGDRGWARNPAPQGDDRGGDRGWADQGRPRNPAPQPVRTLPAQEQRQPDFHTRPLEVPRVGQPVLSRPVQQPAPEPVRTRPVETQRMPEPVQTRPVEVPRVTAPVQTRPVEVPRVSSPAPVIRTQPSQGMTRMEAGAARGSSFGAGYSGGGHVESGRISGGFSGGGRSSSGFSGGSGHASGFHR